MAGVGDIYQIVDAQRLDNQVVLNVYFYKRLAEVLVGNPAQQVADTFEASFLPQLLPAQSTSLVHEEIRVQNLFDATDQYTKVISEAGSVAATDDATPFDAYGIRLVQDNGALRNGSKRIGGVVEDASSAGVLNDSTIIAALVTAGVGMITGLDIGLVANAIVPVIVGRINDGGNYRLPTNSGEAIVGNIIDALYNVDVTSQTSRKYGRGE